MTYSGGGRPHIWVPRRLSGLGASSTPGRYLLSPSEGTAAAGGYVKTVAAGAQGYISQQAADAARSQFSQVTGIPAQWVPTDPSQVGPWAKSQVQAWASSQIASGVDQGRRMLEDKLSSAESKVYADIQKPLDESESAQWALDFLTTHGPPTDQASAIRMARAFVMAQCAAIGLPPEFIAAAHLINSFPTTVENAESWGLTLGTSYLSQFGVPIVTSTDPTAFFNSCGRAAIAQVAPGIPFSLCEATFSSLKDGSINFEEAQGLVVGACAWVGGAIGQAFGLPAPIGAFLCQIVAGTLVPIISDALGFGPSDSEKLNAAQQAASAAAAAATVVCTDLARALWLQYQHYFDSVEGNLQAVIRANQEWILTSGSCAQTDGIRLFPEQAAGANTLDVIYDSNGKATGHYQHPVSRDCPNELGCPYLSYHSPSDSPILRRASYSMSAADLAKRIIPQITPGAPGCDALSALAYWNARRYVTPYQVLYTMSGQPPNMYVKPSVASTSELSSRNAAPWDTVLHSDDEYLQTIGTVGTKNFGTEVGECMTPPWAKYMLGSLQQAASASALVQRDLARTVSGATSAYEIQRHMQELAGVNWQVASDATKKAAANAAASRAAAFRSAIGEAKRKGARRSDLLNYGLLAAGSAALAGWAMARVTK